MNNVEKLRLIDSMKDNGCTENTMKRVMAKNGVDGAEFNKLIRASNEQEKL